MAERWGSTPSGIVCYNGRMRRSESYHRQTYVDLLWQTIFRLGFPVARAWWRVSRQRHQGALVAVHVDRSLLLLRSSYRSAWNFPGGSVKGAETPEAAARRELAEEIGISPAGALRSAGEASGVWDGRRDRVFFFALHLNQLPRLHLDNREIVGARLVPVQDLPAMRLTEPVKAYVNGWLSEAMSRQRAQ
ncbi:MAG TPA: NUDIX domain-containing protein [Rhodopila sp.]|nr:NUDIX domain-containing protein [Rhodopila sp.]